jgi:hypothetical protein
LTSYHIASVILDAVITACSVGHDLWPWVVQCSLQRKITRDHAWSMCHRTSCTFEFDTVVFFIPLVACDVSERCGLKNAFGISVSSKEHALPVTVTRIANRITLKTNLLTSCAYYLLASQKQLVTFVVCMLSLELLRASYIDAVSSSDDIASSDIWIKTDSVKENPSWQPEKVALLFKKFPAFRGIWRFITIFRKALSVPVRREMHPVHALPSCFLKTHFNICICS